MHLLLDPNNGCNLNCIHCGLACRHVVHFSKQVTMAADRYQAALKRLAPFLRAFSLGCLREPLVHPEIMALLQASARILDKNTAFALTTNGVALSREIIDLLFSLERPVTVSVSIESAHRDVYEKIRRGARFSVFHDNMKYLSDRIKEKAESLVQISFSTVVLNINLNELYHLSRYADRMAVTTMTFMDLEPHEHNRHLALSKEEQHEFEEILDQLKQRAADRSTKVGLRRTSHVTAHGSDNGVVVINQIGDIYPPGYRQPIGNVFSSDGFASILKFYI